MSEAFIATLKSLQIRFDVAEIPDFSRVPTIEHGKPMSRASRELQEKQAAAIQNMNTLNCTAGRLLLQNKELAQRAGISERALTAVNPGPCWYVAVNDLIGNKSQIPTGKESAVAIDLIVARLTTPNASASPARKLEAPLIPGRLFVPKLPVDSDGNLVFPQIDRKNIGTQIAEGQREKALAEESGMRQHHSEHESNTNPNHHGENRNQVNLIVISIAASGFIAETAFFLDVWSDHSGAPWEIYCLVPGYVLSISFILYALCVGGRAKKSSWAFYLAIFAGLVCGAIMTYAYFSKGDDAMSILPISMKARFLPAMILTIFALATWWWAIYAVPPTAKSPEVSRPPPPTIAPSTSPSAAPFVRPPASRPTTVPGPDTRTQLQIFRGDPPPIDNLYYAEFGHGPKVELTQWADITDRNEKLCDWVKVLLRDGEPIPVNPETLHIGRDFLLNNEKQLRLYFLGDIRANFDEKEKLSVTAIRQKLMRKITANEPGFLLKFNSHVSAWQPGTIITEWEVFRNNPALQTHPEEYFASFARLIEQGKVEIVV